MGLGKNEKRQNESVSCQLIPGGLAGTGPNGSFFESQAWVDQVRLCQASSFPQPACDQAKAPGMTSQTPHVAPPGWWVRLVTGTFLFYSPNLVWLTIALADYFLFPYDFEAAKSLTDLNWVFYRFCVNFGITFGFFGFWHVTLYILGWSKRPFIPNRQYRVSKVVHNMWYTFLGPKQYWSPRS